MHSAASTSEGELLTWVGGEFGQLLHGDWEDRTMLVKLEMEMFGRSAVMMVSCGVVHTMVNSGDEHTMAVTWDGGLCS